MRSAFFLLALCFAPLASGQSIYTPGFSGSVGPWQASRVHSGYLYYNHSAPVYPISYPIYSRGYGGAAYWQRAETNYELRQIRREVEEINWRRPLWR
jgi:hypothetical protein